MKFAYIGCRTTRERNARGRGLRVCAIDAVAGNWREIQLVDVKNPSYLAFDRKKEYLYTVHGDDFTVSAYRIDSQTGMLSHLNTVQAGGKNPVFVSVDKTNRYCVVSTLQGGAVSVLRRGDDGGLEDIVHTERIPGKTEGAISHPHQCIFDRTMRYICVPAQGRVQGYGEVNMFSLGEEGRLELTQRLYAREYAEPRQMAFHPNNRFAYLVNEKDNTVTFHIFDAETGTLEPKQILPTLPETYTGEGQASAILVHPDGDFVYASNRIHDSIAVFAADRQTGYLHPVGHEPALGKTPRFMTFDETGECLYVANEDSDTIQIFQADRRSGRLTFTGRTVASESPVCILFS